MQAKSHCKPFYYYSKNFMKRKMYLTTSKVFTNNLIRVLNISKA